MSRFSRAVSCGVVSAAAVFVLAPTAPADPPEWEVPKSCSGVFLTSDGSAEVESCVYRYEGKLVAYGSLTVKTGGSTIDNCTMVVKVIDKDAYTTVANEEVASSGAMPCFNGSYPSPPLRIDAAAVVAGHRYASYTEITKDGNGLIRIYSPDFVA
ncbi:hypothetical protein [Nocardia crassostreae]|uniref:hypothetical protein n=1 Tax=Nocardia crassostreae TaxID=53428 RepID=UPI0012F874C7|nr:hypothetical protein [Nocardia crassostreae]